MNFKELLGLATIVLAFIAYIPYFKNIFSGKTKPHAFSWLVWGTITAIAFFGQIAGHAGPGAWVTGVTGTFCFTIFLFSFRKGEKNITLLDWFSLTGAGIALALWFITKTPLLSVILVTLIDALGFIPTFRKSFNKPKEETLITFALSGTKFGLSLFALDNISLVTALYPASLVISNWIFVIMLIIRRKQLNKD